LAQWAAKQWEQGGQWTKENRHILPYALVKETLHERMRDSAIAFFDRHRIKWWTSRYDVRPKRKKQQGQAEVLTGVTGVAASKSQPPPNNEAEPELPTGHLNSSQVACVNHLEPARCDRDVARHLLRNIDPAFVETYPVEDDGYVAYEWIGDKDYLGEPGARVRGANVTSLDALMLAGRDDGTRVLVPFEWKYLESYGPKSVAKTEKVNRVARYRRLLEKPDSPICVEDINWLFYEPYYQLMRQTLLAWQMVKHNDHKFGAKDWLHVHVAPDRNEALRSGGRGAVKLIGSTMEEKWRSVLKEPRRYRLMTPERLIESIGESGRWEAWRGWLRGRYET